MALTTNPNDPRLGHGIDTEPKPQNEVYLVLSPSEIGKGYVRPVRQTYRHVGPAGPRFPLRDLTPEEQTRHSGQAYVKYEEYPESEQPVCGRFWKQEQLEAVHRGGCNIVTHMGFDLAATYARKPDFYGSTYCVGCRKHLAVTEFVWEGTNEMVGS